MPRQLTFFAKFLVTVLAVALPQIGLSQFSDSFSDLDFTSNPTWTGTTANFLVNSDTILQLNDVTAGTSNLSTAFGSNSLDNVEWQFWIKQSFSGSGSNYGRVYLASDQADVSGSLNGYYLQFGESGSDDAVELFQQTGTTSTSVSRGTDGLISGSFEMRVRVRRDAIGNWQIDVDQNGGYDFISESSGTENTLTNTTNFGVLCVYTASNSTKFYYDDFYMGPYILDVTAPEISAISVISATELDVLFNEPIDQFTAETVGNYSVDNGIGNPSIATLDGGNPSLVHLTFGSSFVNGSQYQLTVSGVEDLSANAMTATVEDFIYVVTSSAGYRDVVINEFMADPSPVVGLAESEYVEVFNASNNFIDLTGWKLGDASSFGTVGSHIIGPGEYALLVPSTTANLFVFYPNVVSVTSFPSLNNSGDDIVLQDENEVEVDKLTFNTLWYLPDLNFSDGGYSLEQINPFAACTNVHNWKVSADPLGGTPSAQNSVFDTTPDTIGPLLNSVDIVSNQALILWLNEALDENLIGTGSISFEPPLTVSSVALGGENFQLEVSLNTMIDTGVVYTASIVGLADCEGNLQTSDSTATFILPFQADSGDFVINEVLFNPYTGGSDYVELVNVTNRVLNLRGWQLANFDEEEGISGHRTTTSQNYAVQAGGYVLLTEDTTDVAMNYIQHGINNFIETDLPPFNNDSGTVYLLLADSSVSERFVYTEDMHFPLLSSVDGVSLERLDIEREVNDMGNWHSAAETAGFGTPGLVNSQYYPTSISDGDVTIDPEIFSPDNDGFNDVLNINYTFTEPGNVATIRIYDANGRSVRELATNDLLGASGTFTWDGTTDKGEKARIGMYVILFESFSTSGNKSNFKMSTVLGGRL